MMTRIATHLLRISCIAAVILGTAAPSGACWFPFCWHGHQAYRPVYRAPAYGPAYGSGCSPCGAGGCGVQSYYGGGYSPSNVGCAPCGVGCAPCGNGYGSGCEVGYAPDTEPVPDNGDRRTYAPEGSGGTEEGTTDGTDGVDMSAPGDDDFGPVEREEAEVSEDPFPEFERPVLPMGTEDEEDTGPQPLDLDAEGVTLRVSPTRHRVRAEARYRVPQLVRLHVAPESPWQPVNEIEAHVVAR